LVLLHAFPTDARIWQAQIDYLSSRYRVIAPDFRGFGKSIGVDSFTVPSMAGEIHEFIAALASSSKPVIGGISMGGYVAMNFARLFPDDPRALILIDTKDAADNAEQRENRNRMIEVAKSRGSSAIAEMMIGKMLSPDTVAHRPAVVHALRKIMDACPALTIEHALLALRDRPDMSDEIAKLTVPTLVVVGEADAITPVGVAEAMAKKIRGAELAVIPGAGHMSVMEQPSLVNRAIGRLMERVKKM
jgi:pimeloyl-ACP methyl ester carboxylesterase